MRKTNLLFTIFKLLFFGLLILAVVVPFLKILGQSFANYTTYGFEFIPRQPDIILYKWAVFNKSLYLPMINSLLTTAAITVIGLFITSVSAYILVQKDMPGRKIFAALLCFALVFDAGMIPKFLVIKKLGLLNSLWAVILPLSVNIINIFIMRSYFESIPKNIIQAAELDGCTPLQTFLQIILPLSKPVLAVIGFFFAVEAWNEYLSYVLYIADYSKINMQYKLRDLFAETEEMNCISVSSHGLQCAYIILTVLPTAVLLPFVIRYFDPVIKCAAVKE